MMQDFKAFVMRGNIIDLAIAVVIGAAFGGVVKSLVDDIVMPPIGLALGKVDFTNLYILLADGLKTPPPYASLAEAKAAGAVTLNYGVFINAIIRFLIIAWAVFWMVKAMNRLMAMRRQEEATAPPPPPPEEVKLLTEIRDLLKAKA